VGKLMNDTAKSPKIDDQAVVRVSKSAFDSSKLAVRDFDGREYVGRPFVFEVQIVCDDSSLSFTTALGTHMSLQVNLPNGDKRYFDGIVTQFTYVGQVQGGFAYQACLRPWLWLLHRNVQTRIYQTKTVPDIIKEVFNNADFDDFDDGKLNRQPYRTLEYCVQYQ